MEAVVDIETTGLIKGVHEIVQIAIVPFVDFKPVGRFVTYMRPMKPHLASEEAFKVNGLTLEGLAQQPTPNQVRKLLLEWKDNCFPDDVIYPVGHNYAVFDSHFLELFLNKSIYDKIISYRCMDTCILARGLQKAGLIPKEIKMGLDPLSNYFGIDRSKAHDAYDDCLVTLQVYQKLTELLKR